MHPTAGQDAIASDCSLVGGLCVCELSAPGRGGAEAPLGFFPGDMGRHTLYWISRVRAGSVLYIWSDVLGRVP